MRFIGLLRADASSEAGEMPSPDLMERMGTFVQEVAKAGVLVATDGLKPSAEGSRVRLENGHVTVTDGPFTESKELIASYAIFDVSSKAEAIHWTTRFLEVLGGGECEIRPIFEASDFPPELFSPQEAAREEITRQIMQENAAR